MTEENKTTVTINDKEYNLEDLNQSHRNQIALIQANENKIVNLQGEILVLRAGCDTLINALVEDIENPKDE
jgi:hypothetical protein